MKSKDKVIFQCALCEKQAEGILQGVRYCWRHILEKTKYVPDPDIPFTQKKTRCPNCGHLNTSFD